MILRSRRRLRAPSLSRSYPAPVLSVSPAENLTDTSPFRLPARVFEPSLRTLRATLLQLHQPGCPRDGSGAAHSNRKLPLYLSRRSSFTAVARDDLPPTATRRAVSRAPRCADDLSGAVSRLRISSLDASALQLPIDQTMSLDVRSSNGHPLAPPCVLGQLGWLPTRSRCASRVLILSRFPEKAEPARR